MAIAEISGWGPCIQKTKGFSAEVVTYPGMNPGLWIVLEHQISVLICEPSISFLI
jgi:hypothetical protein